MAIGKGVLGSSVETSGRSKVEWTEGKPYFVQSNGGKALGWNHIKSENSAEPSGHVIIYNIKVPLSDDKIRSVAAEEESPSDEAWVHEIFRILAKSLPDTAKEGGNKVPPLGGVEMSDEVTNAIAKIITQLDPGA